MRKRAALGKIEKEIEKLTPQEKLRLAERLIHQLRNLTISTVEEFKEDMRVALG